MAGYKQVQQFALSCAADILMQNELLPNIKVQTFRGKQKGSQCLCTTIFLNTKRLFLLSEVLERSNGH